MLRVNRMKWDFSLAVRNFPIPWYGGWKCMSFMCKKVLEFFYVCLIERECINSNKFDNKNLCLLLFLMLRWLQFFFFFWWRNITLFFFIESFIEEFFSKQFKLIIFYVFGWFKKFSSFLIKYLLWYYVS